MSDLNLTIVFVSAVAIIFFSFVFFAVISKVRRDRFDNRKFLIGKLLEKANDGSFQELSDTLQEMGMITVGGSAVGVGKAVTVNFGMLSENRRGIPLVNRRLALRAIGSILHVRLNDGILWEEVGRWLLDEAYGYPKDWPKASKDQTAADRLASWISELSGQHSHVEQMKDKCAAMLGDEISIAERTEKQEMIKKIGGDPYRHTLSVEEPGIME
jgi:hypothetical protein